MLNIVGVAELHRKAVIANIYLADNDFYRPELLIEGKAILKKGKVEIANITFTNEHSNSDGSFRFVFNSFKTKNLNNIKLFCKLNYLSNNVPTDTDIEIPIYDRTQSELATVLPAHSDEFLELE